MTADLILHDGHFTTLDGSNPVATAIAISDGKFAAVGQDNEVMSLAGPLTRVIDLKGRRALPGLIDNHLHIIRGGLNFNMELRWDGVRSLADAMAMLKRQVAVTPPPHRLAPIVNAAIFETVNEITVDRAARSLLRTASSRRPVGLLRRLLTAIAASPNSTMARAA